MPPYPMATIRFVANVNTRFSARSPFSFARTRSSALRKKHLLPENFVQIQHRIHCIYKNNKIFLKGIAYNFIFYLNSHLGVAYPDSLPNTHEQKKFTI